MEKQTDIIIKFNSNELKKEAKEQGMQLANCCMQGAKEAVGNIVFRGVHLLFDYLIDLMNAKMSA